MYYQSCANDGMVYSVYSCETCQQLISDYSEVFLDDFSYPEGCVNEILEKGQTPEQMLQNWITTNFKP